MQTTTCNLKLSVILLIFIFGHELQAQSFFEHLTKSSLNLNSAELDIVSVYESTDHIDGYYYVDISEIFEVTDSNSLITVNVPQNFYKSTTSSFGTTVDATFKPTWIAFKDTTDYTYYGLLETLDSIYGYLHIIKKGNKLFGQMQIDTNIYEIVSLFNGRNNMLLRLNQDFIRTPDCDELLVGDTTGGTVGPKAGICNVRVLVLFTEGAQLLRDPEQIAILAIDQSNIIARNSLVNNVLFELAGVRLLENFIETDFNGINPLLR